MAFNPLALLQEQQCSPIYTSLDSGDASVALKQCNELLKKQPDLLLATALKSIALTRIGRKQEASDLADILIKSNPAFGSKSILQALCVTLDSLNRNADEVDVLDAASKANSTSMDIGIKALTAMVNLRQWQKAQQTALRLHKLASATDKKNDEYFWASMQAYSLIANDSHLPGSKLALPLAQRMIAKHLETRPFGPRSDEIMFLYVSILRKMGGDHLKKALEVLDSEPRGRELCKRSMTLASLRVELLEEAQKWRTIYDEAMVSLKNGDENWTTVQLAVKAAIHLSQSEAGFDINEIESYFQDLASKKEKNRTLRLAPLYLIKEIHVVPTLSQQLANPNVLQLFISYFNTFGTKACAFEDLSPYAAILSEQEVQSALQLLSAKMEQPLEQSFVDLNSLYQNLNACKLARSMQSKEETTASAEEDASKRYFALYLCSLPIGKDLPKTEMQPGDEYVLLASQALIHAGHLCRAEGGGEGADQNILLAIVILKAALIYSPKGYRLRVLLIRLLLQCGAIDLARKEYEEIGIKSIQHDTLGWLIVNRASTNISLLAPSSPEEQRYISTVNKLQSVWKEGKIQVPQMVTKAFNSGIFSRLEELIAFGDKLENSLTRWTMILESARLASSPLKLNFDWQMELQKCAASIAVAKVSNQQDHDVLMNLMPRSCPDIATLTAIGAEREIATEHLKAMLPVAMLHVGAPLPEKYEVISDSGELSEEERLLSKLCVAPLQEGKDDLTSGVISLLDAAKSTIRVKVHPSRALHSISIALEAVQLVSIVKEGGKLAALDGEKVNASLAMLIEALEASNWTTSPKVPQEWLTLLGKLPAALRQGRNAQDVLNSQAKELGQKGAAAKAALLQRLKAVIIR